MKTKLKLGDEVIVNTGASLKKVGKILSFSKEYTNVLVKGVNMRTFTKKKTEKNPGGLIKKEQYIHISNIMYYDKDLKKGVRLGYKQDSEKKRRYLKNKDKTIVNDPDFKPFSKKNKVVGK